MRIIALLGICPCSLSLIISPFLAQKSSSFLIDSNPRTGVWYNLPLRIVNSRAKVCNPDQPSSSVGGYV